MDEATLTISSTLQPELEVYSSESVCEQCPLKNHGWISSGNNLTIVLQTDRSTTFYLKDDDFNMEICRFQEWFQEFGIYTVDVTNTTSGTVKCNPVLEYFRYPMEASSLDVIPPFLIVAFAAFSLLYCISYNMSSPGFRKMCKSLLQLLPCKYCRDLRQAKVCEEVLTESSFLASEKTDEELVNSTSSSSRFKNICYRLLAYLRKDSKTNDGRLYSLDAFRGLTVVLMIFINAGGGKYWFMEHALWDHPTFADLPHPWFNWIMGVTIAVSGSTERLRNSVRQRISRILSRFAKLFLLGLLMTSDAFTINLDRIPIFGVLQDLAILYLVVAWLEIILPRFDWTVEKTAIHVENRQFKVNNCLFYLTRAVAALAPMVAYLSIMFGLDVPGCGNGYIGPGGLHLSRKFANCTGGAAAYVDRMIIGNNHLAFNLSYEFVYETNVTHDSYGLFCLLSQLTQVYLGVIAGEIVVRNKNKAKVIVAAWSAYAATLFVVAWLLCNDVTGYCLMPLNRRLWSVTFILVTSALGLVIMIVLYACIEVAKVWTGSPFYYPGTNSIALYVGHELTKEVFPFGWDISHGTHAHYLFMHVWQTVLWIFISILMYKKKIFLRV